MPYYILKSIDHCGNCSSIKLFTTNLDVAVTEYVMNILRNTAGAELVKTDKPDLEAYIEAIWAYLIKKHKSCQRVIRLNQLLWLIQSKIIALGRVVDLIELPEPTDQLLETDLRYRISFDTNFNRIELIGVCPHEHKRLNSSFLEHLNLVWTVYSDFYKSNPP